MESSRTEGSAQSATNATNKNKMVVSQFKVEIKKIHTVTNLYDDK